LTQADLQVGHANCGPAAASVPPGVAYSAMMVAQKGGGASSHR